MSGRKLRLEFRPQVRTDIRDILKYTTKKWGHQQRTHYKALLNHCIARIAANPYLGQRLDDISPGYYRRHVGSRGSHYIYYRVFEDTILLVRVLHDKMEFQRHLPAEDEEG